MAELLKNQFFQRPFFEQLGNYLKAEYEPFDRNLFISNIYTAEWEELALMQRMAFASQVLQQLLPSDFLEALAILKKVCIHFEGFEGILFSDFVSQFGLDQEEESLDALALFTQYGSAEFAIRPFIKQNERLAMGKMLEWSQHANQHVRRLSSEGCRPRLPWAMALPAFKKDPSPILPILENLKDDLEIYVRKSVANNLNDLAKDNMDLILDLLEKWNKDASENTQWIIKQGLRTLVKDGNPKALELLGFKGDQVALSNLNGIPKTVRFGNAITFEFVLTNTGKKSANLMIDYVVHFQKNNGSLAPKVFKLKTATLAPGDSITVQKKHAFEQITTRTYYPGQHKIAIQVNGKILGENDFQLKM